ncbi:12902_t:CDS:1, partial [Gigaspora rosea]
FGIDITEQSDSIKILNTFIKNSMNAFAILAKKLISLLEVEFVLEICKVAQHRHKAKNYVILFKNKSHLYMCLGLT